MRSSIGPGAPRWALVIAGAIGLVAGGLVLVGGSAAVADSGSAPCYGASYAQPAGGAPVLDVVSFGLFYNCGDHSWQVDVQTSDNWSTNELGNFALYFNTDGNPSTGCSGYDRAVIGTLVNGQLQADALVTSSCDPTTFLIAEPAVIVHPQPNVVEMAFTNNGLGNPSSFTWHGDLGASGSSPDRFPAAGDLGYQGFPPVPAGNPCPSTGGMAVVAPGMVGPARAALVAAGFASVSVLPAGVLRFAGSVSSASAVLGRARITAQVSVDRVERFSALPNDPGLTGQWNVPLIDVPAAWNITTGSPSIVVADLDSGVDGTHPDLQGKLAPGFDITTGAPLGSGNTDDSSGHGTAVAGIIGAATNNGIGVAGIGWQTKVAEVRLSDPPALSEIVAGLLWATNAGYPIINLSFTGCADPTEAVAIQYARQHGVLVVAAAGNDALDGNPLDFPAAFPGVIAVGATDHNGVRAAYSEYGSQVSLVAPGGSADGNPSDDLPLLAPGGGTRTGSGTSFAAPQVAAVAALALAASPSITPDDAGALMMATAAHIQSSPDVNYGRGIVDAGATVADASHLSRAAGSDRYGTAAAVAALGWPRNATIAYVASGLTFPDALATGALAGVKPGPILLTDQCSLPASTAAALKRLQPDAIYVVGGTAAVCSAVDTAITSATGLIPSRLAGDDRYGTAEAISKLGWPGTASTVYVTTGVNFPDGLTGSARAAKDGAPLLLTDQCTLPLATRAELLRLQPTTVKLIGGTAAICAGVASSISSALPGATVTRIAGVDRVSTGTMVAADGWSTASSVLVASADNFPDALSAGALAALEKMPLMINGSCSIDPPVAAEVPVLKPSTIVAIGGASALCGAAVAPLVVSISAQPLF